MKKSCSTCDYNRVIQGNLDGVLGCHGMPPQVVVIPMPRRNLQLGTMEMVAQATAIWPTVADNCVCSLWVRRDVSELN